MPALTTRLQTSVADAAGVHQPHCLYKQGNAPPTELQIRKAGVCTFSRIKSSTWAAQVSKQYSSLGGNCLPRLCPVSAATG